MPVDVDLGKEQHFGSRAIGRARSFDQTLESPAEMIRRCQRNRDFIEISPETGRWKEHVTSMMPHEV